MNKAHLDDLLTPIEEEPDPEYPPKGTEETALILAIDCDNFTVLAHTGRFMHAQLVCAGVDGEYIGLNTEDVVDPGYWVMEKGSYWESRDWETNVVDDGGLDGEWRRAALEDFAAFDLRLPIVDRAEQDRDDAFLQDIDDFLSTWTCVDCGEEFSNLPTDGVVPAGVRTEFVEGREREVGQICEGCMAPATNERGD